MREILFRGKRTDNGEWVEGGITFQLPQWGGTTFIAPTRYSDLDDEIEVIPETIGQYTGLIDKNGKKIFEGDILAIITTVKGDWTIDENGHYKEPKRKDCAVVQEDKNTGGYRLKVYHEGKYKRISKFDVNHIQFHYRAEVIGNIHDKPELLEEKE